MKGVVDEYVKNCTKGQLKKILGTKGKAPIKIMITAEHPFERCVLDILGPLTETASRYKHIVTFHDNLSKFIVAVPIPQQDVETVPRAFVLNILLRFGAPAQVLTDQRSNFLSDPLGIPVN